jgi:hypothetical protein
MSDDDNESSSAECYIDDFVMIHPTEFHTKQLDYLQKILSNRNSTGFFELMITEKYRHYFPNHVLRRIRYSITKTGDLQYCFLCLCFFYVLACEPEFQIYIEAQLIYCGNLKKLEFYRNKFLNVLFIETEKLMASAFNESNSLMLIGCYNSQLSMIWRMQDDCSSMCDAIITFSQTEAIKHEQDQESKKRVTTPTDASASSTKRNCRR